MVKIQAQQPTRGFLSPEPAVLVLSQQDVSPQHPQPKDQVSVVAFSNNCKHIHIRHRLADKSIYILQMDM